MIYKKLSLIIGISATLITTSVLANSDTKIYRERNHENTKRIAISYEVFRQKGDISAFYYDKQTKTAVCIIPIQKFTVESHHLKSNDFAGWAGDFGQLNIHEPNQFAGDFHEDYDDTSYTNPCEK